MDPVLIAIVALLVGGAGAYAYQNVIKGRLPQNKKDKEDKEPTDAREIILDAKNEAFKIKREAEEETRKVRSEVLQLEARVVAKEETLDKKISELESRENSFKLREEEVEKEADEKAKAILIDAMKNGATDYVAEYTTSIVRFEDEDMKGRIIGREGRNIRAFELSTGVDVDLDDSPGTIRLSSFDGERREVAKVD